MYPHFVIKPNPICYAYKNLSSEPIINKANEYRKHDAVLNGFHSVYLYITGIIFLHVFILFEVNIL